MLPERLPFKNWPEYKVDEFSADPSTPETNDWQLYFKSGGLYYIDDAGSVTGPLAVGAGDVTKVGTPANDQVGVWTGDGTIEGTADLTFASNQLVVKKDAIGVTQGAYGLLVQNTTAALTGERVQYSPPVRWRGYGWETDVGSSMSVDFRAFVRPITGAAAPTGGLDFQASIDGGAFTDLVTILSNGKVGIGMMEPSSNLYVSGSADNVELAALRIANTDWASGETGQIVSMGFYLNRAGTMKAAASIIGGKDDDWDDAAAADGYLAFKIRLNDSSSERIRISSNGNVGIGTTAPGQILDCNDGSGNMIADGYDNHPSIHAVKENAVALTGAGMIDKLKSFKLFEFTRRPFVSADELRTAALKHFSPRRWVKAFGGQVVEDESGIEEIEGDDYRAGKLYTCPDEGILAFLDSTAKKLRVERRKLPEWQRKHLGPILDDPGTKEALGDVIHYDEEGKITGYSLNDQVGFLEGCLREVVDIALDLVDHMEVLEAG